MARYNIVKNIDIKYYNSIPDLPPVAYIGEKAFIGTDLFIYGGSGWKKIQVSQPTYSLSSNLSTVTEGSTVSIQVATSLIPDGTNLAYTISGVDEADIVGSLTGTVTITEGLGSFDIEIAEDTTVEANDVLSISLNVNPGSVLTIPITDNSSTSPTNPDYDRSYFDELFTITDLLGNDDDFKSDINLTGSGEPPYDGTGEYIWATGNTSSGQGALFSGSGLRFVNGILLRYPDDISSVFGYNYTSNIYLNWHNGSASALRKGIYNITSGTHRSPWASWPATLYKTAEINGPSNDRYPFTFLSAMEPSIGTYAPNYPGSSNSSQYYGPWSITQSFYGRLSSPVATANFTNNKNVSIEDVDLHTNRGFSVGNFLPTGGKARATYQIWGWSGDNNINSMIMVCFTLTTSHWGDWTFYANNPTVFADSDKTSYTSLTAGHPSINGAITNTTPGTGSEQLMLNQTNNARQSIIGNLVYIFTDNQTWTVNDIETAIKNYCWHICKRLAEIV